MDYAALPSRERILKTVEAVNARGIHADFVETKGEALAKVRSLIPPAAIVMTAGSVTLQEIGFEAILISGQHPWHNFKAELLAETDPIKQSAMRRQGTLAEVFLGSVNAIAETGELIFASGSGSQLPAYAYTSRNVIWVSGAQKITPTLDDALRRVREYTLPLEDERQKKFGNKMGSSIGRILIFEHEPAFLRRNLTLILVNEVLGF